MPRGCAGVPGPPLPPLLAKLKLARGRVQRAHRANDEASFAGAPARTSPQPYECQGKAGVSRILRSAAQGLH